MELEFHDSTLATMVEEGRDVVVSFRPAYVRAEEEGVVSGYAQDVDIRFVHGRVLTRPGKMPVWISDGVLKTKSGAIFDALLPVPHSIREAVSFSGITAENEGFQIEASGCVVELIGPRRFIEKIP